MARKKKTLPVLENIEITDIAAEGKALAKIDGMAVFVPYIVPGDVVDIQLRRKKHSFAEGEAILFHKKTPLDSRAGSCTKGIQSLRQIHLPPCKSRLQ